MVSPSMPFSMTKCTDSYGGTCVLDKRAPRPYGLTDMACHFPTFPLSPSTLPSPSSSHSTYSTAASMTLLNGDVCRIGGWVLFSHSARNTDAPALGRVHEIIILSDVAGTQQYPKPDAILLQRADIAGWVEPYRMPRVCLSNNWAVANVTVSCILSEKQRILTFRQHLLCSANVQHQCFGRLCAASGSAVIYQERQATNQMRAVIVHDAPDELMLNTARMHDASHFSWHRFPIDLASLDFDQTIMNGTREEIDSRKRANVGGRGLLGRGRASRGRGGSSSRNVSVLP